MTMPRRSGPSPAVVLFGALVIGVILVLATLAVRGDPVAQLRDVWASFFPKEATTSQGVEIRGLYDFVFFFAAAIFLIVEGLIVYAVLRYRRKPTDVDLPPQIHGNNLLEIVWTIVPTIIVAILFFVSWQTLNSVDAVTSTPDVRVRAVAGRYQWGFDYLDASGQQIQFKQFVPELDVPVGKTVHLTLQSTDVIHAFYVPQFLFKRDVVPGRENNFDFRIDPQFAGKTFTGQCAELCGEGHYIMQFTVKALAPDAFDAWLQQQIQQQPPSPPPSGPPPSGAPPASAPPSGSAPAPSASAPTASAAPSGGTGAGPTLQIAAKNTAYDVQTLEAPANTPFTIHFDNQDAGIPHNVSIHQGSPTGQQVFMGTIFSGPSAQDYQVPALAAGTYGFVCTVHSNMTGTLTVK
jgi:cytochrome c oxidase subunit 2